MSCILFSRVSFLALAGDSRFQELCEKASIKRNEIADTLFKINVAAYFARYCGVDGDAIHDEVADASTHSRVNHEFMDYLRGERSFTTLRYLFLRIDYQSAEPGVDSLIEYQRDFAPLLREVERLAHGELPERITSTSQGDIYA